MGSDDEIPEDEEEILVYVEIEGLVDGNAFSGEQLHLDMIGVDTEHPIMQINGRFYEGTYEDAIGTYMFFTRNENPVVDDPVFDTAPSLKYFAKTRKLLRMQRVFIKPRTEVVGDSEHSECIPNLNTLKQAGVPLKYQEEAFSFWKNMRDNRMNALHSYLEKQRIREEKRSQGIALDSESDEDSPFAAYKHREENKEANEPESTNTKLEKDSLKEVIFESSNTGEDIRLKELENLTLIDSEPSTSKDSNSKAKSMEVHKAKLVVPRKKKITVIHDARKKKCRKKVVSVKGEKLSISKEEKMLPSAEVVKKSSEFINTGEPDMPMIVKVESNVASNNQTTTVDESKFEISQSSSTSSKISKQVKREAKMKEISERLKIMVEKQSNTKVD